MIDTPVGSAPIQVPDNYVHEIMDRLVAYVAARGATPLRADLVRFYALLVLLTGGQTTVEHVHDAWSCSTIGDRPEHKSIVMFADLDEATQDRDYRHRDMIHTVAQQWARRTPFGRVA